MSKSNIITIASILSLGITSVGLASYESDREDEELTQSTLALSQEIPCQIAEVTDTPEQTIRKHIIVVQNRPSRERDLVINEQLYRVVTYLPAQDTLTSETTVDVPAPLIPEPVIEKKMEAELDLFFKTADTQAKDRGALRRAFDCTTSTPKTSKKILTANPSPLPDIIEIEDKAPKSIIELIADSDSITSPEDDSHARERRAVFNLYAVDLNCSSSEIYDDSAQEVEWDESSE